MSKSQKTLSSQKKYLDDLLKRRFFLSPSFDIYGGVAGLYDYGPAGCAVKNNLEAFWREHFILEESMLEINTTCLTPARVLKASGHTERFTDLMVKDVANGNVYRADKYLDEWIDLQLESKKVKQDVKEKLKVVKINCENYGKEELDSVFREYQVKSRDNNDFGKAEEFNLMFATSIGPTGNLPETAQGIFVNFAKLLEYNNGKLPFAGACLGLGFRNEIAPRAGILRVREFQMAEIEHFVDPLDKNHPKFESISHLKIPLFSACNQLDQVTFFIFLIGQKEVISDLTLKEAVEKRLIDNETLAYFMGRTYQFLLEAGISEEGLRFRQHMANEMAHYAKDCWDAEVLTSYGWIECVGHADRAAFDLNAHSTDAKVSLQASRQIEPVLKTFTIIHLNKPVLGKHFKQDQKHVLEYFELLSEADKLIFREKFEQDKKVTFTHNDKTFTISEELVTKIEEIKKNVQEEKFTPSVIEPSFGIGRILYGIFEHAFKMRDEKRTYLNLSPRIAPVKCSILTLMSSSEFTPLVEKIRKTLVKKGISCKVDDGNQSIGKRYARTDEIGIPFGITVDKESLTDLSVTLREINSTRQMRVPIDQLTTLVSDLIDGSQDFLQVIDSKVYPEFAN